MYEKEILEELKEMNRRLAKIEELLYSDKGFGGETFRGCLMRMMFTLEEE